MSANRSPIQAAVERPIDTAPGTEGVRGLDPSGQSGMADTTSGVESSEQRSNDCRRERHTPQLVIRLPHTLAVVNWICWALCGWLFAAQSLTAQEETESAPMDQAALAWLSDLPTAYRDALANQRPILVRVGSESCSWCRKLEQELAEHAMQLPLSQWTLVYLDVDKAPEEVRKLNVGPIPALRVLNGRGRLLTFHDGYMPADELVKWLQDRLDEASAAKDELPLGEDEPTMLEVMRLVRQFEHRDATVREAAIRRLLPCPQVAGRAVVKAFSEGSLSAQLTSLEILDYWQAPVSGIDPWQSDTFTPERKAAIDQWLQRLDPKALPPAPQTLSDEQRQALHADLQRMSLADEEEAAAIRERLARLGMAALPEVVSRLQEASTDQDRQRLLTLRYRLVAGGNIALTWPGGLERLADSNPQIRHQAAGELAEAATDELQPLLLELFSDPDPLVRELSLRGLRIAGGKQATAALAGLLKDPEPNVRAAVLKQLSEDAPPALIADVTAYVKQESDPDLVVHGVRYFRAVKDKRVVPALLKLLEHDSWQVRAEAAEGIGEVIERFRYESIGPDAKNDDEDADVYDALLKRLADPDAFVVSRVITALQYVDAERAVEPLVQAAIKHPPLAKKIVAILAGGKHMRQQAIPQLRAFLEQQDPALQAAAVTGLCQVDPENAKDVLVPTLSSSHEEVRIAAAESALAVLHRMRPGQSDDVDPFGVGMPFTMSDALEDSTIHIERGSGLGTRLLEGALRVFAPPPPSADRLEPPPGMAPTDAPQAESTTPAPPEPTEQPAAKASEATDPTGSAPPATQSAPTEVPPSGPPVGQPILSSEGLSELDLPHPTAPLTAPPSTSAEGEGGDQATDQWLAEFHAGEHREAWTNELVAPLTAMLQALSPAERHAAAVALIPLGHGAASLPVLLAAVTEDRNLLAESSAAFAWLERPQRQDLFWQLNGLAVNDTELAALVSSLRDVNDSGDIDVFWQLLERDNLSRELLSALEQAIQQACLGDSYYDPSSMTLQQRRRAVTAIEPHVASGPPMKQLVAIQLYANVEADKATQQARRLMDDATVPDEIRVDAFQLQLLIQTAGDRIKDAMAVLSGTDARRQKIALQLLAMGASSLRTLAGTGLDAPYSLLQSDTEVTYFSPGDNKPIVPEPPRLLEADQVRPLLASSDPETAAYAGYLLTLFGEQEGLRPLLQYWRAHKENLQLARLVYRAIASLDDPQQIPVLRDIYSRLKGESDAIEFYWTIRIMSGPEILQFRKKLRQAVGMSKLQ